MTKKNKGMCWHEHHDLLVGYCRDYKGRLDFIDKHKPPNERPLRKKLMQFVKGKLPDEVCKAVKSYEEVVADYKKSRAALNKSRAAYYGADYKKSRAAYDKARVDWAAYHKSGAALNKSGAALDKAIKRHSQEIEALHAKECPDCPWNGKSIFPKE